MANTMGDDALLEKSLRHLLHAWDATHEGWNDQARTGFSDDHLKGIEERTRLAAVAIKRLEQLIDEVRRQCT